MGQINYYKLLNEQKDTKSKSNLYYISQLEFAYNSSKLAGISLSDSEITTMYNDNIIMPEHKLYNLEDIFEVYNHFNLFNYILVNANNILSEEFIKRIYKILKKNTQEEIKFPTTFGEYRKQNLPHLNYKISSPENIQSDLSNLIQNYEKIGTKCLDDIVDFHYKFECIHPFSDANARLGRILMFKECLRNNVTPFIILNEVKLDYYRGLKAYSEDKKLLIDYFKKLQQIYENAAIESSGLHEYIDD